MLPYHRPRGSPDRYPDQHRRRRSPRSACLQLGGSRQGPADHGCLRRNVVFQRDRGARQAGERSGTTRVLLAMALTRQVPRCYSRRPCICRRRAAALPGTRVLRWHLDFIFRGDRARYGAMQQQPCETTQLSNGSEARYGALQRLKSGSAGGIRFAEVTEIRVKRRFLNDDARRGQEGPARFGGVRAPRPTQNRSLQDATLRTAVFRELCLDCSWTESSLRSGPAAPSGCVHE